jgi:prepilin-type N-terminal cleavage/methylation domain-containing protein
MTFAGKTKQGFTLIELLVVIAIIALLLSILTPALNSVKERAKRLLCLNALKQWGIAITAYNATNDNLMFIPRRWGGAPFAHYMAALPPSYYDTPVATGDMKAGEFSVYAIDPYIDCVGKGFEDTGQGSKIFACPNCSGDFMVEWVWACWDEFCRPPHPGGSMGEYFVEPAYSYWVVGGMKSPIEVGSEASANILKDLTIDTLSSKRLLMSEVLCMDYDYSNRVSFRYNHGRGGWAWCLDWADVKAPGGHVVFDGEQDATGRSQLFGDGHVQWRDISLKPEDNIPSDPSVTGMGVGYDEEDWNGRGSGWIVAGENRDGLFSWY